MVRIAGRGRPPGGPSWAILPHGPPGGRALPEGGSGKEAQGLRLATPLDTTFGAVFAYRGTGRPVTFVPLLFRGARLEAAPSEVARWLWKNFKATSGGAASCRAKWMGCGRGKGETGTRLSGMENAQCAIHSGGFCFETTRTTRDNFFKVRRPTGRRLGERASRPRGAEEGRGWKPHLRKWRDGCSEGTATVPLSPPGRTRGSASLPRGSARGSCHEATE